MKKQLLMGVLAVTFAAASAFAVEEVKLTDSQDFAKVRKEISVDAFGARGTVAGLAGVKASEAQDKLVKQLTDNANDQDDMSKAFAKLTPEEQTERLQAQAEIATARQVAQAKGDKQLTATTDALTRILAMSDLITDVPALKHITSLATVKSILNMEPATREVWTKFMSGTAEALSANPGRITARQAAITGLKNSNPGMSDEQASQKLKLMEDCT